MNGRDLTLGVVGALAVAGMLSKRAGSAMKHPSYDAVAFQRARAGQKGLTRANLAGARLKKARLEHADLRLANLNGADLRDANLSEANLHGSSVQGARMEGAVLRGADLRYANLFGSNMTAADLRAANLQGASLENVRLKDAMWDGRTVWPEGYRPHTVKEHLELKAPSSANFKRWFGNSVVRNGDDSPAVLYHGTKSGGFSAFDLDKADAHHPGFYFTNDLAVAASYVGDAKSFPDPITGVSQGVYRVYLKIERPLIHDAKGRRWDDLRVRGFKGRETFSVAKSAKDAGYDGVIFRNILDPGGNGDYYETSNVYVVFDPTQIKSATDNAGTFDPADSRINFNRRTR